MNSSEHDRQEDRKTGAAGEAGFGADGRRQRSASDPAERFRVPGAEILDHDTWAEDAERCPECGVQVAAGEARCAACGQWLERCSGSCSSCASPRCVGGKRDRAEARAEARREHRERRRSERGRDR